MHFYPGVAEYAEFGKDPYRVFLNEDTIRAMDPTFAGRPIFVEHVDEVEGNLDELRKEADGWVIESFYNAADGKHWAKFIVVSERGEKAIKAGMRLSNAYIPNGFGQGGLWNGVSYQKEITSGEYEHLAIVRHPRYEESVIMTPEEFKKYNDDKLTELKRLANSKDEKEKTKMKLNFFKRAKVENAIDPELSVVLPKTGREVTIVQLVNEADVIRNMDGYANADHMVKLHDGSEMKVGELVTKHKAMCDEIEAMKAKNAEGADKAEGGEAEGGEAEEVENAEADDEAAKKKALELAEHEDKEIEAAKKKNEADEAAKKKADEAKKKADALRNAHLKNSEDETALVEFSVDQVARGKSRYGSN